MSQCRKGAPAHTGDAGCGQLGQWRSFRHARDVHRAADLGHEAAQRVRLPEADRVNAIDAGLQIDAGASHRFGDELRLGFGGLEIDAGASHRFGDELLLTGAGKVRPEEDVNPGVDHERVAGVRRGLANRPEPFRVPVGIPQAPGGVVCVLEIAAGGPGVPESSHERTRLERPAPNPCQRRGRGRGGHVDLEAGRARTPGSAHHQLVRSERAGRLRAPRPRPVRGWCHGDHAPPAGTTRAGGCPRRAGGRSSSTYETRPCRSFLASGECADGTRTPTMPHPVGGNLARVAAATKIRLAGCCPCHSVSSCDRATLARIGAGRSALCCP